MFDEKIMYLLKEKKKNMQIIYQLILILIKSIKKSLFHDITREKIKYL